MILLISFIHYYCIAFWDLVITVEVQVVYIYPGVFIDIY